MAKTRTQPHVVVVGLLARGVSLVAASAALVLAGYVVFVVFEANPRNPIVSTVTGWADGLVLWFQDLFTPRNPKVRVLVNYGLAALAYLLAGRLAARVIRTGAR
ncbi:hypothetical protein [Carbonactinospora thermoautotrophica]|uniref:hypothetical protein n=1 Tax=Carbonactinospora thermoautotrophica TaxID=1469144 RepID=UPI00082B9388|nr:hypothetical protein [Carbonactinospora thermoautotrophica]